MKTATFKIEGMHCDGCAETVKMLVEKEPGPGIIKPLSTGRGAG